MDEIKANAALEAAEDQEESLILKFKKPYVFEGKEYTDTKTEAIPATGHDTELVGAKDATCTEDGYTGDEVCKVCQTVVKQGKVIPALGHDYKDGKCSRCGAEEPTTPVEPGKPATGDSSTLVLWLALLAVSGMAVTVIPSRKKRSTLSSTRRRAPEPVMMSASSTASASPGKA